MSTVSSTNPYTNEHLKTFKKHTKAALSLILKGADHRFYLWRETSYKERKELMFAAAEELLKNKQEYAETMTKEIGKPISQSIAEIEKCAWVCKYYAENAEKHMADINIETDAQKSYTKFEPLGVLLAVMPWNYPFWQVFRFAAPALMAGNIGLLKHASNVFGSALNIEKVFKKAGFPDYCFTTLLCSSDAVKALIEDPIIKAVTLTGSGPAGSAVAQTAGKNIKKTVLELGGNNALIVMKDCDIDATVAICVQARFQNTGQSCIAGKRLLIDEKISEAFIAKLVLKVRELKSGDPMDTDTYIGTMATEYLAVVLEEQVNKTIKAGGKLLIGGKRQGAYFEPTIVSAVSPDMPMFAQETFGPALSITTFKTVEEAIDLSNNSRFGLGVSVFTNDVESVEKIIYRFDEGAVFINSLVKSDPRLPFGGVKESGYGRELSSHGIQEFVNRKTIYISN
jgi:succinate-semialdehyde dehydrogenase/glutarate-semialdehyde dehydrogenase